MQATEEAKIKISDIVIDDKIQVRLDLFVGIEELAVDIQQNGLMHPPSLRLDPKDQKYHLVAGRRRIEACKKLGWKEIPYNATDISEKDAIHLTIAENLGRNDLSPMEEAKLFQAAVDLGWKDHEIAKQHGKTLAYVKDRLALLETAPQVQELVQKKQIGMETVKRSILTAPKEVQAAIGKIIADEHLDPRRAQERSTRITEQYEEEQKFKQLVAESEYQKCPTCKKPALPRGHYDNQPGWAQCREDMWQLSGERAKHIWNLKTGQTLEQKEAIERSQRAKERIEERKRNGGKGQPAVLTKSFRSPIPVDVIRQAVLNEAISIAKKRLSKGARRTIRIVIDDDFRITVEDMGDTLSFDLADGSKFNKDLLQFGNANVEPKIYGDKNRNLTKISPSQTSDKQETINLRNAKYQKWINTRYLKLHNTYAPINSKSSFPPFFLWCVFARCELLLRKRRTQTLTSTHHFFSWCVFARTISSLVP